MKNVLMAVVATIALVVAAMAQGTAPAKKSSPGKTMAGDANAAITKIERDWEAAMHKNDAAAVGKLLSDAWLGVNPDGSAEDKAHFLSEVKQGQYQGITLQGVKVKIFGNTAVATGEASDPKNGTVLYMDVFTRQGAGWKVVASQLAKKAQ